MGAHSNRKTQMIILFHHIQKTGGNTLIKAFEEMYGESYVIHPGRNGEGMTGDDVNHIYNGYPIMISSHSPGYLDAIARQCNTQNIHYITLLREPLDRSCSHFAHLCRNGNHSLWSEIEASMINGVPNLENYLRDNPDTEVTNLMVDQLCRFTCRTSATTAQEILKSYAWYGYTHNMEESLRSLSLTLKLPLNTSIGKTCYNASNNRPLVENLPTSTQDLLKQCNGKDLELWESVNAKS
jgi:hypothetical protein